MSSSSSISHFGQFFMALQQEEQQSLLNKDRINEIVALALSIGGTTDEINNLQRWVIRHQRVNDITNEEINNLFKDIKKTIFEDVIPTTSVPVNNNLTEFPQTNTKVLYRSSLRALPDTEQTQEFLHARETEKEIVWVAERLYDRFAAAEKIDDGIASFRALAAIIGVTWKTITEHKISEKIMLVNNILQDNRIYERMMRLSIETKQVKQTDPFYPAILSILKTVTAWTQSEQENNKKYDMLALKKLCKKYERQTLLNAKFSCGIERLKDAITCITVAFSQQMDQMNLLLSKGQFVLSEIENLETVTRIKIEAILEKGKDLLHEAQRMGSTDAEKLASHWEQVSKHMVGWMTTYKMLR